MNRTDHFYLQTRCADNHQQWMAAQANFQRLVTPEAMTWFRTLRVEGVGARGESEARSA